MNYLSREELIARATLRIEEVAVPQWDTTVRVRELSAIDKDKLQMSMVDMSKVGENGASDGAVSQSSLIGIRAKLVCYCVVDEDGERIFTDADLPAIGEMPAEPLEPIFDVAMRLSGMSKKEQKKIAESMVTDPLSGSSTS